MRSISNRRDALGKTMLAVMLLMATQGCEPASIGATAVAIGIGLKEVGIIAGVVVAKLAYDAHVEEAKLDHERKMLVLKGNVGDKEAIAEIALTSEQQATLEANNKIEIETPDGRKVTIVLGEKP